jgi:B12-binding domain/radical SAM domain protein
MEISRGCPWGCHFCQTSFLMGRDMRHRSLDSIVRYAELSKRKGLTVLRFISPNAFAYGSTDGRSVNLEAIETMLKAVSEIYGADQVYFGSFPSEVRPEHVTPETLALVKRYCANRNLVIGAQSGSERLLKAMHRGHGVPEILRAVKLACAASFTPNVDFIFGLPGETSQDRTQTLDLMQQIIQMGARIHSHTFMPLVGTPYARCEPGVVDQETRALLQSLRGKSLEHGSWKTQEQLAKATTEFLMGQTTLPHHKTRGRD